MSSSSWLRTLTLVAMLVAKGVTSTARCECAASVTIAGDVPAGIGATVRVLVDGRAAAAADASAGTVVLDALPCTDVRVQIGQAYSHSIALHFNAWVEQSVRLSPGADNTVRLTIPELRRVEIRASNDRSEPLAEVGIRFTPVVGADDAPASTQAAFTALDGMTATYLPASRAFSVDFPYSDWKPSQVRRNGESVEAPFGLEAGRETASVGLVFSDLTPILGNIRDEADRPVPDVAMDLRSAAGEMVYQTAGTTNANGDFTVRVREFPAVVVPRNVGMWEFSPASSTIQDRASATMIHFVATETKRVRARIVDREGNGAPGLPLNASFQCASEERRPFFSGRTDEDGYVALPCPSSCEAQVRMEPRTESPYLTTVWNGRLESCDEAWILTVRTGVRVEGDVRDVRGNALSGLVLSAGQGGRTTTTDDRGAFVFRGLAPGSIALELSAAVLPGEKRGLVLQRRRGGALEAPVEITVPEEGGEVAPLHLVAVQGGSVCVRGSSSDGGLLPSMRVTLEDAGGTDSRKAEMRQSRSAPPRREACVYGVPPGTYAVRAESLDRGYARRYWPGVVGRDEAKVVSVQPKRTETVSISLPVVGSIKLVGDGVPKVTEVSLRKHVDGDVVVEPWILVPDANVEARTSALGNREIVVHDVEVGDWEIRTCPENCVSGNVPVRKAEETIVVLSL